LPSLSQDRHDNVSPIHGISREINITMNVHNMHTREKVRLAVTAQVVYFRMLNKN